MHGHDKHEYEVQVLKGTAWTTVSEHKTLPEAEKAADEQRALGLQVQVLTKPPGKDGPK